ncbi:9962_t:CDS:1, partial [Acaulospora morrowiae]
IRTTKYLMVEQALVLWIDQANNNNYILTGHIVLTKATYFAQHFEIQNFIGLPGWFNRFKKQYNIQKYIHYGEANLTSLEDLTQQCHNLQNLLST